MLSHPEKIAVKILLNQHTSFDEISSLSKKNIKNLFKIVNFGRYEYQLLRLMNKKNHRIRHMNLISNNLYSFSKARTYKTILAFEHGTRLIKAFNQKKISFEPLKGMILNQKIYKDLTLRPMRDIDFLIKPEDTQNIFKILREQGFKSKADPNFTQENISNSKYFLPPFSHKDGTRVDLHTRIDNRDIATDCLFTSKFFDSSHSGFIIELHILHLIFHATQKEFLTSGPIILQDLNYIFKTQKINFDYLLKTADEFKLKKDLVIFLTLLSVSSKQFSDSALLEMDFPPNFFNRFTKILLFNDVDKYSLTIAKKGLAASIKDSLTTNTVKSSYQLPNNKKNIIFYKIYRGFGLGLKVIFYVVFLILQPQKFMRYINTIGILRFIDR